MKNTGLLLKHKRERSNLSLSEVALSTKINPKILSAMENGEEAALPAKTFLKGFVRSYASYLKMDVEEVMRSFNEEMGPTVPVVPKVEVTPEGKGAQEAQPAPAAAAAPSSRRPVDENESRRGLSAAVVVIVLLIGMIIGVRELIDKYQREKVVEVPADLKAKPLANPEAVPSPAPASVSAAQPATVEPVKAEPAKTEVPQPEATKPEATKEVAKVEEKKPEVPAPVPAALPSIVPSAPAPAPVAEAKPAPPTITPSSALAGVKTEIILEALDSVDVKFELKGEKKKVSLAPSQVHTIRTTEPVTLDLSDGGAVNIILNGRERGVPGDLGKPKTIKIP